MRKILIIALGIASLGALAGVQPAAAGQVCNDVCVKWGHRDPIRPHDPPRPPVCWHWQHICTQAPVSQGPGPVQNIQQQKTKYLK